MKKKKNWDMKKEIKVRPDIDEIQKRKNVLKTHENKGGSLKKINKIYDPLGKIAKREKTFSISGKKMRVPLHIQQSLK